MTRYFAFPTLRQVLLVEIKPGTPAVTASVDRFALMYGLDDDDMREVDHEEYDALLEEYMDI